MQTQSHKDVVKNITTASQLEGELQLSQAQHGVAVLDIYNAEWGHCKALSETFRRLSTDAGDMVHLRFFSVECNAVLDSLHNPEDAKAPPRQKGMEFSPETLVAFWSKMLEQRQNHSKPYFAFYKEGKMRSHLEGIDTPKICRIVHDLCKQQNAAAEYITNQDVLRFWESNFSPAENEVGVSEFNRAVRALLGADAAELSGDDLAHLTAAVHTGGGEMVSASSLQAFVGDNGTLREALMAVVAERRGAAGTPAASADQEAAELEEAAPRAASPQELDERAAEEEEEKENEAAAAGDGHDYAEAEAAPADGNAAHDGYSREQQEQQQPLFTGQEEEAPETANNAEADAYREIGDDDDEAVDAAAPSAAVEDNDEALDLPEEGEPGAAEVAAAAREEAADAPEAAAAAAMDELDDGAHDRLEKDAGEHHEELEELDEPEDADGAAASAIAASSSAAAPSMPDGVSAERDRDLQLDPSSAPQHAEELSPSDVPVTPSPPPPPAGAVGSPDSAAQDDSTINQIFTNRWVTVSEEEMHVWNTVAALPLHYPESTTLMADLSNNEAAAREALPDAPDAFPTLAEHLAAQGVPFADVNMMCIAADQKVGSESLSYGKLSLILMSCDSEIGKGLVPECEHFLGELSDGTLLKRHQPLAFTALALSASEAYPDECFYYCLPDGAAPAFQALSENDTFILHALTPLNTAAPPDGVFALRIIGLPKVIELATTDESDDTMVLSQWFARLRVAEVGADALTVHFVENVCDEEFNAFITRYLDRLMEDESHLDKKQGGTPAENAEELGEEDTAYEIGDEEEEGGGDEAGAYEEASEANSATEL